MRVAKSLRGGFLRSELSKTADIIELLVLATLWGGSFLFMRIAAPVLGPVWLIEMRVLLAGLALLPLLLRLNLWG